MAHFRGTLKGARGEASRLATKNSGLRVEAQSWEGKAVIHLTHDAAGFDVATFYLEPHKGAGITQHILSVRVDGSDANASFLAQQILEHVPPAARLATWEAIGRNLGLLK